MTGAFVAGEAASRTAARVDSVFLFIAAVCLFFFLLVEGLLVFFAIRYRRRRGREEPSSVTTGNLFLETIWILIPSVVVISFFVYGYVVFRDIRSPRAGASDIHVVARQFFYEFRYPDGRKSIGELRVEAGRPVKLVMTSEDVIHGFFIPAYRIKQDILPGRFTTLYLEPDRPGTFDIFCTQYCGVGHSTMRARLVVMAPPDYASWAAGEARPAGLPPAERGKRLVERSGCLGCHPVEGTAKIGPPFRGLFGRRVELSGGGTATADENYIRESLYDPGAKIVKGFPNVMPTFKGSLSEDDVSAIASYLKSLSEEGSTADKKAKKKGGRDEEAGGKMERKDEKEKEEPGKK